MKLFKLTRIRLESNDPVYDCYNQHLVRAENEGHARLLASRCRGDEGMEAWLFEHGSLCSEVLSDGEPGVLLSDYNAG